MPRSPRAADGFELHDETPVYVISVAAELAGLHPQTLRQYDRLGLVSPGRSSGRGRRYSVRDVAALREVARLSADGVSLAGIKRILELEAHIDALQRQVAELQSRLTGGRAAAAPSPARRSPAPGEPRPAARTPRGRDVVPVSRTTASALVVWSRTSGASGDQRMG